MVGSKRRKRRELRVPIAIDVMLSGQNAMSPEWAVTENISARGVRILTSRSKYPNEYLLLKSVEKNLRARGKVVYRQCLRENLFAIGVKLLAAKDKWEELPASSIPPQLSRCDYAAEEQKRNLSVRDLKSTSQFSSCHRTRRSPSL